MAVAERPPKRVRTTVSLPKPVFEEVRLAVEKNLSPADTINGFFVAAIVAYLKLLKRKQIDSEFAAMSKDADYQTEARLISEEFSQSDWEALESAQRDI
jgi:hypothetical protein